MSHVCLYELETRSSFLPARPTSMPDACSPISCAYPSRARVHGECDCSQRERGALVRPCCAEVAPNDRWRKYAMLLRERAYDGCQQIVK